MDYIDKASLKNRGIAFFIDSIIMCIIQMILFMIIECCVLHIDLVSMQMNLLLKGILISTAISSLYIVLKDTNKGESIGKKLMRIKVIDKSQPNTPPGFWRLALRNIFLLIWPIELLILLISGEERKRLGDYVLNTEVIEKN